MFDILRQQASGTSEALLVKPTLGEEGPAAPATADRLTLEWNKQTVQRFKSKLAGLGVNAFLVRNPLNTTYLIGYWHTTTERPEATFMNHDDADPWLCIPRSTATWFAAGGSAAERLTSISRTRDRFPTKAKWRRARRSTSSVSCSRGSRTWHPGNQIGIDGELYPSESAKAREILPDVEWVNVDPILMDMRIVKTPEELALWRRAYVYFDRAHAFARDYILTHGTGITDYEVAMATQFWINQQLYSDLELANGAPHRGVKSGVEVEVRTVRSPPIPIPTSLTSTASDAAWPCRFQEARASEATAEKITVCTSSPTRPASLIPTCASYGK